jgi:hypothetical protein
MTQQQKERDDALKAALGDDRAAQYAQLQQQAAEVSQRIADRLQQGKKR